MGVKAIDAGNSSSTRKKNFSLGDWRRYIVTTYIKTKRQIYAKHAPLMRHKR